MYIRKRGQFYHFEFFVNGKRYAGSFNGKNDSHFANDKREARELAYQERRKVLDGTYRQDMEREELKDFATFVDKIYLPFAREHHSSPAHDGFRCEVLKEYFKGKRFDEITMMMVVKFINQRLSSETVRKEVLENDGGEQQAQFHHRKQGGDTTVVHFQAGDQGTGGVHQRLRRVAKVGAR
jgi:hypothetical protein